MDSLAPHGLARTAWTRSFASAAGLYLDWLRTYLDVSNLVASRDRIHHEREAATCVRRARANLTVKREHDSGSLNSNFRSMG